MSKAIFTRTHHVANGLSAVLDAAFALKARERHDIRIVLVGDGSRKHGLAERFAVLLESVFEGHQAEMEGARV